MLGRMTPICFFSAISYHPSTSRFVQTRRHISTVTQFFPFVSSPVHSTLNCHHRYSSRPEQPLLHSLHHRHFRHQIHRSYAPCKIRELKMAPSTPSSSTSAAKVNDMVKEDSRMTRSNGYGDLREGKKWTGKEIRDEFIAFFGRNQHTYWQSSPVVPHNDPTLLFINAGMNQFKPILVGAADPSTEFGRLKRAANSQKCIRAGGKHNDLEDVGKDVYHHTFFEMLGNWSFGDYFKQGAIDMAWDLLVNVYKLPQDRLYATYFGGDPKLPNCPVDDEARALWLKYLPEDRILPFAGKDNFWEMGDVGPCGPCTEIHYDRIGGRDAASLVNADDPSVLEIWNLVFMQYNREKDGQLIKLPAPCVDTGMGLERLASILQGFDSNYDTDLFQPIFDLIRDTIPGVPRYEGKVSEIEDPTRRDAAYRVVADHIRCLTVAICDGAEPSNEGRGYVLRRILRRAVRFGRQFLNAPKNEGWFYKLVDGVVNILGDTFPELKANKEKAKAIIKDEEMQFSNTLDKGVERFNKVVAKMRSSGEGGKEVFPGTEAFTLYTTFGFPLDLTQVMAEELKMEVDVETFNKKFEEHQMSSDAGGSNAPTALTTLPPDQKHELETELKIAPTNDKEKYNWTTIGHGPPLEATVVAVWNGKEFMQSADETSSVSLVLDRTNFYAEAGGQIADVGEVSVVGDGGGKSARFTVIDVQRNGQFILHAGQVTTGKIKVGDKVILSVDFERRARIAKGHTATHLINYALREVTKGECEQKGSLVEDGRLRFDFGYGGNLDIGDYVQIEDLMSTYIKSGLNVSMEELPLKLAREISGVCTVFGEQYPDPVRVVGVGRSISETAKNPKDEENRNYSIEFCGGTHISNSSEIETFVLTGDCRIAKGVRRLNAYTGPAASEAIVELEKQRSKWSEMKKKADSKGIIVSDAEDLINEMNTLRVEIEQAKNLPLIGRREVLNDMQRVSKKLFDVIKSETKKLQKAAKEWTEETLRKKYINRVIENGSVTKSDGGDRVDALILSFDELRGDGKLLGLAIQAVKDVDPSIPFIVTSSLPSMATVGSTVSKSAIEKFGLKAGEWTNEYLSILRGKGGMNDEKSNGSARGKDGDEPLDVQKAELAVEEYVTRKGMKIVRDIDELKMEKAKSRETGSAIKGFVQKIIISGESKS